jgi:hypothetical protein
MTNCVVIFQIKVWVSLLSCEYFFNKLKLYDYLDDIMAKIVYTLESSKVSEISGNDIALASYTDILNRLTYLLPNTDTPMKIKIYNLIELNTNNLTIDLYDGIVIKFKVGVDKECLFSLKTFNDYFPMLNIAFYKSEVIFNIYSITTFLTDLETNIPNESNDIVLAFITELKKYNINTIFFIGAQCSTEIRTIIMSYNILCVEWLNWNNYEVF